MARLLRQISNFEKPFEALDSYHCEIGDCNFVTQCPSKMLSHYNVIHRRDKKFTSHYLHNISCLQDPFTSFDGLNKHMKTYISLFSTTLSNMRKDIKKLWKLLRTSTIDCIDSVSVGNSFCIIILNSFEFIRSIFRL